MRIDRAAAYATVDSLATWSEWKPFATAAPIAPRAPGVYQMRTRDGSIVYVGMAGERKGQGLRGRLSIYRRGKGAMSGFGEAALDRALADAAFIEEHLDNVRAGRPARAATWAQDAIRWLDVEVRWTECDTGDDAHAFESKVVELLVVHGIWNRVATRAAEALEYRRTLPEPIVSAEGVDSITVAQLTHELGRNDGGRAVRRILREGFPDHVQGSSWDPLSPAQVAHVRGRLPR